MSRYRRSLVAGGTFFFTVTLAERHSSALVAHIDRLRQAYGRVQREHPFETMAICVLPDHLHAVWTLPADDADFSLRWSLIKAGFSRGLDVSTRRSASKVIKREKGIWQRRFWEHQIRDDLDLQRHVDYIHFNPVKHGHVVRVADWPHSSFHRDVERGIYPPDWAGNVNDLEYMGEQA
jgi:putative transposase